MRRNLIEKGRNTDNADSIAIGTEAVEHSKPGQSLYPTTFEFTQNTLIFDRKGSRSEPAHEAGANEFGKLRHIPAGAPVKITGNIFVNMKSWGEFPNFSSADRMFPNRDAAGLPTGDYVKLPPAASSTTSKGADRRNPL